MQGPDYKQSLVLSNGAIVPLGKILDQSKI